MTKTAERPPPQRNALAPALLAAVVLMLAPILYQADMTALVRYPTSILALIMAVFALRARQWWWVLPLLAIAVLWNPVYDFSLAGPAWNLGHWVAAVALVVVGACVKERR